MTTISSFAAALEDLRSATNELDGDTKARLRVWKHSAMALVHPIETIRTKRALDRLNELCTDLTTLYVAGAMPLEAAQEFEQLVASEPVLGELAGPIMAAWQLAEQKPGPSEAEVDQAYAQFRAIVERSR